MKTGLQIFKLHMVIFWETSTSSCVPGCVRRKGGVVAQKMMNFVSRTTTRTTGTSLRPWLLADRKTLGKTFGTRFFIGSVGPTQQHVQYHHLFFAALNITTVLKQTC